MKFLKNAVFSSFLVLSVCFFFTCNGDEKKKSGANSITAFSFTADLNEALSSDVPCTISGTDISNDTSLVYTTDITNLIPTFTATGVSVTANGAAQVSGVTANDFTNDVEYTVTAENGAALVYTVTVNKDTPTSTKAITAFSFLAADNGSVLSSDLNCTIAGSDITSDSILPYDADVSSMVATFTDTGVSVHVGSALQLSGDTTNDFSGPVTYTVTAQDTTTQDFKVYLQKADPSTNKAISAFSFLDTPNAALSADVTCDISGTDIACDVPIGTDVTALIADFTSNGLSVAVSSTGQTSGSSANNFAGSVAYTVTAEDTTTQVYTVTLGRQDMADVPANTDGFVMGFDGVATPKHTVPSISAFTMGKYEVTYELWYNIKTWAVANSYGFDNDGAEGNDGTPGNAPTSASSEPVTAISWYDAVKWCNALSEKEGLTPVYYTDDAHTAVFRDATADVTNTQALWTANGYRLPTNLEWEYAARYIDGVSDTSGDAPSGWLDNNTANGTVDDAEIDAVAWWNNNATKTMDVGGKLPNALDIYDMSGNVWEWGWDWTAGGYADASPYTDANTRGPSTGTSRVRKSSSYTNNNTFMRTSVYTSSTPLTAASSIGFRIVK